MSEINVLPPEIFNRIAAGEVVERPASVVKELVENSIDAGATVIKVRIERAGTKLISVSDNGRGMDENDALLSLKPHCTSKISKVEDIDAIHTLGFRGEALPSIVSVSRFMLRTRRADAAVGFEVTAEGGSILHSGPAGCAAGTEIAVRDLFFNTPARRKFLKSYPTEDSYIEEALISCALSNMNISFELTCDGRQVYFSAAGTRLEERLRDLFGKNFAENMLPVDFESGSIRVTGRIAKPGLTRSSRREQRGFVNGRPVESQAIFRGIRDGFGTLNERGRYSPCVIFLQMPAGDFDINVHPAKRDVRFRQEYNVSRAVTMAVAKALRNAPAPETTLSTAVSLDAILQGAKIDYQVSEVEQPIFSSEFGTVDREPAPPVVTGYSPPSDDPNEFQPPPAPSHSPRERAPADEQEEVAPEAGKSEPTAAPPAPALRPDIPEPASGGFMANREYLGAADNTYLLLYDRANAALEIMDQHAAHERVLYEKLLGECKTGVNVQPLLLPGMLELARPVTGWLTKNGELLSKLGFELSQLSSNTLVLNAVPALLPDARWEEVLLSIYQAGRENSPGDSRPLLERTAAAACHAAVKAHDPLRGEEVEALLRQLSRCERPDICPHGRPTTIKITIKELEKRFGRT